MGELLTALEPVVDIFSNLGSSVSALISGDWSKLSESTSALLDSFKNLGSNVLDFGSNLAEITSKSD